MAKGLSANAQSLRTKQAEVEFHNFASLGEPETAIAVYAAENVRRGAVLAEHAAFIGSFTPFLEIGANAGHTSYMLANRFGADGFALDISADALRHGIALMPRWGLSRAPVRLGGDAARLPFRDGSLRLVLAYQTLSQFTGIERVFEEVERVLAPGGVFLFAEEPLRRLLSLRLYRSPYEHEMRPWERRLFRAGLLGYLAQDVIGSRQEEVFGIEQNHGLDGHAWQRLAERHFAEARWLVYVPERGPAERWLKRLAWRAERRRSYWLAAELLGGSITGICRKAGSAEVVFDAARFEQVLRCPDCGGNLQRTAQGGLACLACPYQAPDENGVYNLLPSRERAALYPGDRDDNIDFSIPGHETKLLSGWYELEGVYGGRYRWMGEEATARLQPCAPGAQRLRIRGYAAEASFRESSVVRVSIFANDAAVGALHLRSPGTFLFESGLPAAQQYLIRIRVDPTIRIRTDSRPYGINVSLIRLAPGG
jgi:SAM-dependent methyltransferase